MSDEFLITCSNCGEEVANGLDSFCSSCGIPVLPMDINDFSVREAVEAIAGGCDQDLHNHLKETGRKFCHFCGRKMQRTD